MTRPPLSAASPKKNRAIANRASDHGQRQRRHQRHAEQRRDEARAPDGAASLRPTAWPTRTVAAMPMPNGTMNRMAVDLQRDLMRRQRGGADQAHQQGGGGKQSVFQQERDRDRRADHDQLAHQHPVDAPDPAEHVIFPERPAVMGEPQRRQEHAEIDHGGGEAGAEQFQPRQSPFAVDQEIDQHGIGGDRDQRDPQPRLRPVDRAHEAADGEKPQRRQQCPRRGQADIPAPAARSPEPDPASTGSARRIAEAGSSATK